MIATIWPEENFILETLSTLNFAKRMKNVVNELSVNIRLDTDALLKKLTKEIKDLKQELLMHNTLSNRGKINYDPYTPEEQYEQQLIAQKFFSSFHLYFLLIRRIRIIINSTSISQSIMHS